MEAHSTKLGELAERFFTWLDREVAAGRRRPGTAAYYRRYAGRFVELVGADRLVESLIPYDLEQHKNGWHDFQAVQRLFNWSRDLGLIRHNPFIRLEWPQRGERSRVLTRSETAQLLRSSPRPFRRFLAALRHTLARPQELRALRWHHLQADGKAFALAEFKGKDRRRDGLRVRLIALDARMRRFVERCRRSPDDYVFTNSQGKPWTGNALRCAMRRARKRAGLLAGGELVVCYTFRHTAATEATARGVRDRMLADLMGHSTTRTTARYQHLRADHLVEAIDQATARGQRRGA